MKKQLSLIFPLLAMLLFACSETASPEDQLRDWLVQMETAVTEKKTSAIKALISDNYKDDAGTTKQQAMLQLILLFKRYDNIAMNNTIQAIEVNGDFARLEIETKFSQSAAFASLGLTDNGYFFELLFERDGDKWLLNYLRYETAGE